MKTRALTLICTLLLACVTAAAATAASLTSGDSAPRARPPAPQVAEVNRYCTSECKNEGNAEAYEGCMIECQKNWKEKDKAGSDVAGTRAKGSISADR
jgi:hypothetical protein